MPNGTRNPTDRFGARWKADAPPPVRPSQRRSATVIALLAVVLLSVTLTAFPGAVGASPSQRLVLPGASGSIASSPLANLTLQTSSAPSAICAINQTSCAAGVSQARIELTAQATQPTSSWPAVQVAFLIETSAYDGVYDPHDAVTLEKQTGAGYDSCGLAGGTGGPLCEESNGVPFFEDHVGAVTSVIQSANPNSKVTFAMADYASSCDVWDDYCDQAQFHVDTAQFLDAGSFTSVVASEFKSQVLAGGYVLHDEDLADNFLHSPVITGLHGVINGDGFAWSNNTHHVIILMGSTAPRDPAYVENYCVSGSGMLIDVWGVCADPTCEPAHSFPTGVTSPNCEGWVRSQDGNPTHSIAALAHTDPNCVNSVGGVCTIDVIDLWNTPTDPFSQGWPTSNNGATTSLGPGTPRVLTDASNILLAGCDLAAATGGTWSGPSFFSCPNGQAGGLVYVPHGTPSNPNTQNPTLLSAFKQVGFGPVEKTLVAVGSGAPMFTYVPPANFHVSPTPEFAVACETPTGFFAGCQAVPKTFQYLGTTVYGWNWSENLSQNRIYYGDAWHVSFNVVNTGPPFGSVALLRCGTPTCLTNGAPPINGIYSWAHYLLPNTTTSVLTSFPLAKVMVSLAGLPAGAFGPPPPPLVPPYIPVVIPPAITQPVAVGIPVISPIGSFSLQAMAAGLLMAGLTRVIMKNKPIAMLVAVKSGPALSKFEAAQRRGPDTGHFE